MWGLGLEFRGLGLECPPTMMGALTTPPRRLSRFPRTQGYLESRDKRKARGVTWLKAREPVIQMHLLRKMSDHFRGDCCHVLLCKNRQ